MAIDAGAERLAILEALADRIDATLWMASPDLAVWHYMNAACTAAYGFTADEATAEPGRVRGRFHPDDAERVEAALARARSGEDAELVYRMRQVDDRYRWQLTRIYPVFDEAGRVDRILGTGTEITELKELEEQLRLRTDEAEAAILAIGGPRRREDELLDVLQSPVVGRGDLPGTYALITGAAARALGVQRASVWLFDDDRQRLTSALLYDGGTYVGEPAVLERRDYPRYFEAIEADRTLLAVDAHRDPRTSEFSEGYLGPLGITSMLDVTVRHRGEVIGVLCCEQVGPPREWSDQEAAFAWAVADLVSRARTVNDRTRSEEALVQVTMSAEQYETIANGIDVMFWIVAADLGSFRYLNKASERTFGWSLDEIQRDPQIVWDRIHPDDLHPVLATLQAAVATAAPVTFEYRMRDSQERTRWYLTSAFPDPGPGGEVAQLLGTATDITARRELEELLRLRESELEESNLRFETIADTIDTMFWVASPDLSDMHYINGAVEQGFGYAAAEIYAEPSLVVHSFHPDDAPRVLERLALVAAGTPAEVEFRVQTKAGEWRWLWAKAYPDVDEDGSVARVIGTAVDITERRALEAALRVSQEEAQEANRAKSAFLATMTHEIRTPMIGVTGMLEVLSHTELDLEQHRALAVVRQSADALLQVLGDVLDFSKIEAGRLELEPVPTDLAELVTLVVRNFDHHASSKGLLLTHAVDARVAPALEADPVRVRQILTNFLSNALKFTLEGRIHVTLVVLEDAPDGQRIELAVADTGIGISEANQERLFERFTQAESSTTRRFGGTGLGLSICKLLAEMMGGEITLESREGEGTTMRLQVRLDRATSAPAPTVTVPAAGPVGRRLPTREESLAEGSLLLLVEDHPINRLVLTQQLSLAGFAVDTAVDGREGLERWRTGEYGLVFSDLHMPEMDGHDLARAIRAEEAAHGRAPTPLIALTAATLRDELDACLEAGMDDVVVKPTSVPVLVGTLRRWLPDVDWTPAATSPASGAPEQEPAAVRRVLAALADVAGGDPVTLDALRAELVRATEDDLAALVEAVARRDGPTVARHAHRLKGSSRMVGADAVAELAERLERHPEDWAAVAPLVDELVGVVRPLLDGLAASG